MIFNLSTVKKVIMDLLFPVLCVGCGQEGMHICDGCVGAIKKALPACMGCRRLEFGRGKIPAGRTCSSCASSVPLYAHLSPFLYEERAVKELVHRMKYRRVQEISNIFAEIVSEYIKTHHIVFPEGSVLVPIPLAPARERVRGFNQAHILACGLSFRLKLPMQFLLKRVRNTRPQAELSGEERMRNMENAFAVDDARFSAIVGATCILVDDVKTTGATLYEAAYALKRAGAKRVWAVTIAR